MELITVQWKHVRQIIHKTKRNTVNLLINNWSSSYNFQIPPYFYIIIILFKSGTSPSVNILLLLKVGGTLEMNAIADHDLQQCRAPTRRLTFCKHFFFIGSNSWGISSFDICWFSSFFFSKLSSCGKTHWYCCPCLDDSNNVLARSGLCKKKDNM